MFFICFLAPHNLQIPQKCLFCLGVFFRLKSAHPSVKCIKLHTEHTTQPDCKLGLSLYDFHCMLSHKRVNFLSKRQWSAQIQAIYHSLTNLCTAWIDYKKRYDSMPHTWILKCLELVPRSSTGPLDPHQEFDRDEEVQANSTSLHQVWDLPSRCSVPTDRPEPPLPDDWQDWLPVPTKEWCNRQPPLLSAGHQAAYQEWTIHQLTDPHH